MKYHEKITEHITEDAEGNQTVTQTTEIKAITANDEPDYIKLYTRMWCEFNGIQEKWRPLFLALVCRMSYASLKSSTGGQVVYTIGTNAEEIMQECGWKTKDPLYRGLNALCDCNAIRKIGRGQYQINPSYAGRGPWRYNAAQEQGGVRDLVAKFSFADKKVETDIIWGSTDKRQIGHAADEVLCTETRVSPRAAQEAQERPEEPLPGQTTLEAVTGPTEAADATQEARSA